MVVTETLKARAGATAVTAITDLGYKLQIREPSRFRAERPEASPKVRAYANELCIRVAGVMPPRYGAWEG